jgi:hypothetical protein
LNTPSAQGRYLNRYPHFTPAEFSAT